MAISKQQKGEVLDLLKNDLDRIKLAVLTDYRGLSTGELEELRAVLGEQNIDYRITKNTLLKLALKDSANFKQIEPSTFNGPMALALGFDDEIAAARLIFQFGKEHEALQIVGALTPDGQLLSAAEVKALAVLPTKDQLRGQLVNVINSPLANLVGVLAANLRQLINVLNAIQAK